VPGRKRSNGATVSLSYGPRSEKCCTAGQLRRAGFMRPPIVPSRTGSESEGFPRRLRPQIVT